MCDYLEPSDLGRLALTNKHLLKVARAHRTTSRIPLGLHLDPRLVRKLKAVWPHLPLVGTHTSSCCRPVTCARPDKHSLYMGHDNGMLCKIDMRTGQELWSVVHNLESNSWKMQVVGPWLYTGDSGGTARKIATATGLVAWQFTHMCDINCLCVTAESVWTGCADGTIKRISLDGKLLWEHDHDTDIACLLLSNGLVHFVDAFGMCGSLCAANGRLLGSPWHFERRTGALSEHPCHPECLHERRVQSKGVAWEFRTMGRVEAVWVEGHRVVFSARDCKIRQVHAETGRLLWEHVHPGVVHDVFMANDMLYTSCSDGTVRCMRL